MYLNYFMFGKYNGFVSKARVSASMYFLVVDIILTEMNQLHTGKLARINYFPPKNNAFISYGEVIRVEAQFQRSVNFK